MSETTKELREQAASARTRAETAKADAERLSQEAADKFNEFEKCNSEADALDQAADNLDDTLGQIERIRSGESIVKKIGRGRPAKIKLAKAGKAKGKAKAGRPAGKAAKVKADGEPRKTMRDVITSILSNHKNGLALEELVAAVMKSGYESSSNDWTSVTYQALRKLKVDGIVDKVDKNYVMRANNKAA